jgi:ABC-type polar amino acid transport system ATPase subunit
MITITDLHKRFGDTEVLCGITMHVEQGEVSVLLGPSGGGKSTLLRTINGLETFDRGQIQVDDLVLGPAPGPAHEQALREIRRRVGMVFQQFNLFPHRTVLENVIESPIHVLGKPRDEAIERARSLLDRVGLSQKLDAMPGNLSGGQQQRVAIARALAMEPEAILFDEPTASLDPRMTAEVISVITDLAQSGQTMVVVTHAMGFARTVAHTVHVMHAGRVAESGPPEQIFQNPREEVTKTFLSQAKST